MANTPEHNVVEAVLTYLRMRDVYAWRNNVGAVKVGPRFIRFGRKGLPDIIGILPDGRFLAIECKAGKGRLTPEQAEFLNEISDRGGCAFVAYGVEDVIRAEQNGWRHPDYE